MKTSTLAAIVTIAFITLGVELTIAFRTPPERRAVEDQIHMVIPGPIAWDHFTRAGQQRSVFGGMVDVWDAEFTVGGHHMTMRFLAYHTDGRLRVVPIG
jgi:hypothetical protein